MRRMGAVGLLILNLVFLIPVVAAAQDTFTKSATATLRGNDPVMRGFDLNVIVGHGPTDPFPDTSTPRPNINSVPDQIGSSRRSLSDSVGGTMGDATVIQTFNASIDSNPGTLSARAHKIQTSFEQQESEYGQIFNMAFSVDAMTDADGNPVNVLTSDTGRSVSAKGTFTQTVSDPTTTGGATLTCTGSFTYDATNGYVLESGPGHQCQQ